MVIGVNDAYKLGDFVDAVYFNDSNWFHAHKEGLKKFNGLKFSVASCTRHEEDINTFYRAMRGIILEGGCCAGNKSSGGGAINLAAILGAKKIVLLGPTK